MIKIEKPKTGEYPEYCIKYFALTDATNLFVALEDAKKSTIEQILSITPDKEDYRYAKDKWTIKMALAHIIDCERIYAYRALRFSRKDNTELDGFNEDDYALNANTAARTMIDIMNEYKSVRESSIKLFSYMTTDMLDFKGIANKVVYTPRSLGWMMAGHNIHHCNVIKERYL